MRFTSLGMVLMPIVFLVSSVMFYGLGSRVYSVCCFLLSVVFAVVLMAEALKEEE